MKTPARSFSVFVQNRRVALSIIDTLRTLFCVMEGKHLVITVQEKKRRRSLNQNGYYWSVVVPSWLQIFRDFGNDADEETVHEFLKEHIGGIKNIIDVGGMKYNVVGTSTKLSTADWEDWMQRCRAEAASYGYQIPMPNEMV